MCNEQVCYDCLRVFEPAQQPLQIAGHVYCQQQCADRAGSTYAAVEGPSNTHFAALSQYCGTYRERFPLLAARLACSIVQNGHSPAFEVSMLSTCFATCQTITRTGSTGQACLRHALQAREHGFAGAAQH